MIEPAEDVVTLGRSAGPYGDVVLRRRGGVEELVVDGAFAIDSAETSTEAALGRLAAGARRVLVGGLGLGYTVAAVLDAADRAPHEVQVDVVELEPALVAWAATGLTPTLARVGSDVRVRLHVADVAAVLQGDVEPAGPWDAVLLDVDNGPGFLIHLANEALYGEAALRRAYDRLAAGGVLAVWCEGPSPDLLATLVTISGGARIPGSAREHLYDVRRGDRLLTYAVYTLTRAVGVPTGTGPGGPE